MRGIDQNNKIVFCGSSNGIQTYRYGRGVSFEDVYIPSKQTSPMAMKKKKCTHQHAFRGTCLTCGKENV